MLSWLDEFLKSEAFLVKPKSVKYDIKLKTNPSTHLCINTCFSLNNYDMNFANSIWQKINLVVFFLLTCVNFVKSAAF